MVLNPENKSKRSEKNSEFDERVIEISRVSRVVKGGRRIRFRVLVIIGDRNGRVSYGIAKANEIAVAVKKAVSQAKKRMINVPIINDTIPYTITVEEGSAKLFLGPASQGTSIVAGGAVRVMAELAGIKNILSKVIGTSNKINNVKAVYKAFNSFDSDKVLKISNFPQKKTNSKKYNEKPEVKEQIKVKPKTVKSN
jgi:small subunit ribosomal protein S5